jgi:hypothetical protein
MSKGNNKSTNFDTIRVEEVPRGRKGKHHLFVGQIVDQLANLQAGSALKIPFNDFKDTRLANLRAALNRATRAKGIEVSTSTDSDALYVWRPSKRR